MSKKSTKKTKKSSKKSQYIREYKQLPPPAKPHHALTAILSVIAGAGLIATTALGVTVALNKNDPQPIPPGPGPTPVQTITLTFSDTTLYGTEVDLSGRSVFDNFISGSTFDTINPPQVDKEYYTFVGWVDENGTSIKPNQKIWESTTIYPSLSIGPIENSDNIYTYINGIYDGREIHQWGVYDRSDTSVQSTMDFILEDFTTVSIPKKDFNLPIYFGNRVTNIPDYFLYNCTAFNQFLYLPSNIKTIGNNFLMNCTSFDNDGYQFTVPDNVTTIGDAFMCGCENFSQQIRFSPYLESIGSWFLANCKKFNSPILLSKIKHIGFSFLSGDEKFNQPIVLPETLNFVGGSFLFGCDSMVSNITVNVNPDEVFQDSTDSFATMNQNSPMAQTGMTTLGPYAAVLRSKFPPESEGKWRKWQN